MVYALGMSLMQKVHGLLLAATKLGQGNIFTGVCDSVNGGGGCLPQCMLRYHPPSRRPPTQEEGTAREAGTPWKDSFYANWSNLVNLNYRYLAKNGILSV